ncbi:MAG: phosphatidate cytidylyltransferase [Cyclobacteriaceae bacterium]|nr:phosphatidate cytidylyltransferase [Cyclobacteriaceae bacterium]
MTSNSKKFSSLGQRVITALVGAVAIVGGIYWGMWGYFIVFLVISFLTLWEFYKLAIMDDMAPLKIWGSLIGSGIFVLTFLVAAGILPLKFMLLVFPFFASVFLIKLYKKDEKPFTQVAYTFLGIIYVTIPFSLLSVIAFDSGTYRFQVILGMLFILWASDTGAYFSGILFGKKKLFKRISPKKTWEGSIGGALLAMVFAYGFSIYFNDLTLIQWFLAAGLIVIAGIYGDLVESLFKRSIAIKDSGSSIPGHGGFLDRFDGLLLASPFVAVFISLI